MCVDCYGDLLFNGVVGAGVIVVVVVVVVVVVLVFVWRQMYLLFIIIDGRFAFGGYVYVVKSMYSIINLDSSTQV